jgi:hypothetical protein
MGRFLGASSPRIRVIGGSRFDQVRAPDEAWAQFGSFYFAIPQCVPLPSPKADAAEENGKSQRKRRKHVLVLANIGIKLFHHRFTFMFRGNPQCSYEYRMHNWE